MATTHHSHTNRTNQYQVVGNCQAVVSSHSTQDEALAALAAMPHIDDTEFANLYVVAPGETVECDLQSAPISEPIKASDLPWTFEG